MTEITESGAHSIGIVGAGAMGQGIAQVTITGGMTALLYDSDEGAVEVTRQFVADMLGRAVDLGSTEADQEWAEKRSSATVEGFDLPSPKRSSGFALRAKALRATGRQAGAAGASLRAMLSRRP